MWGDLKVSVGAGDGARVDLDILQAGKRDPTELAGGFKGERFVSPMPKI